MASQQLGDKGLAVFAFAAYHQLTSGEVVSEVVLDDGAGHHADPQGVQEVQDLGLATVEGKRAVLTESGSKFLATFIQAIQGTAKHAERTTAVA